MVLKDQKMKILEYKKGRIVLDNCMEMQMLWEYYMEAANGINLERLTKVFW